MGSEGKKMPTVRRAHDIGNYASLRIRGSFARGACQEAIEDQYTARCLRDSGVVDGLKRTVWADCPARTLRRVCSNSDMRRTAVCLFSTDSLL